MDLDESPPSSWDFENEMNQQYQIFSNNRKYNEIDRLIHQITIERNWANAERKNKEIDFFLNRIESWQNMEVNDAKETSTINCGWCTVVARKNIALGARIFTSSNLFFFKNLPGNTRQAQLDLEQIRSLFRSVGFPNMIYRPYSNADDLKLVLGRNIEPGTRKLFALVYFPTADRTSSHIAMYKVWKTTDGVLRTTLIDFQFPPSHPLRNQYDFYPKSESCLFYDVDQLTRVWRKRRNLDSSFTLTSDPRVLMRTVSLKANEWIDINAMITFLEAINNNVYYYEGVRLANHFQYVKVQSAGECFKECQKNNECEAITFRTVNNDGCHFYRKEQYVAGLDSEWVSISKHKSELIGGLKNVQPSYRYGGVRLTNHFQYVKVQSAEECFKACRKNNECEAITFRPVNNDGCHFYRKEEYVAKFDSEWVSITKSIVRI